MIPPIPIPRFPVELLIEIITVVWHMSLSREERITFMLSSSLVNSTWADIFDTISLRDVYIPRYSYSEFFIRRMRKQSEPPISTAASSSFFRSLIPLFKQTTKELRQAPCPELRQTPCPNLACRSITIQIANVNVHPDSDGRMWLPMRLALEEVMDQFIEPSFAPNLRRLTIEYVNAGFDDVFTHGILATLPSQVTHLELRYSFSEATPSWLVKALREKQVRHRHVRWIAESITHLSVLGAGPSTIKDALTACGNTQVLEVDTHKYWFSPLRSTDGCGSTMSRK
ncbi:hypothetical protein B0H11DRAFT_1913629 [Mycena galericulata]|nr:hypothetical protein B0H11DRAFT_1913629 [Mycena galericulata]